jgi:hypothetical protein
MYIWCGHRIRCLMFKQVGIVYIDDGVEHGVCWLWNGSAAFDLASVGYLGNVSNVFTSLIKVVHMTCTVLEGSGGFSHVD